MRLPRPRPDQTWGAVARDILRLGRLLLRAMLTRDSFVSATGFGTVTCTTYPARHWAALIALDSVGRGAVRPRRIVLFLDRPTYGRRRLPLPLRLASGRGAEIILLDQDDGSYKKLPLHDWFPDAVALPVVTMDDDVIYPADWLSGFARVARDEADTVLCYRGRIVRHNPDGTLAPYASWPLALDTVPRLGLLPTGVGGVLYPLQALLAIHDKGTAYREAARNVDDLWFRFCGAERGIPARQVRAGATAFQPIPFTQGETLYEVNVLEGRNDEALARLRHLFSVDWPGSPAGDPPGRRAQGPESESDRPRS